MEIERAMEILDPEHREHYESIEPVKEACRMGMEALRRVQVLERAMELACQYYLESKGHSKHDAKILAFEYIKPEIIKEAEKELEEVRNAKSEIYRCEQDKDNRNL